MVDFAMGIATIQGLYKSWEKLKEVKGELEQVANLRKLLDLERVLMDAERENLTLQRELGEVKAQLSQRVNLEFVEDGGFYIIKSDADGHKYCPNCWHTRDDLCPLEPTSPNGSWTCRVCDKFYSTRAFKEEQSKALKQAQASIGRSRLSQFRGY